MCGPTRLELGVWERACSCRAAAQQKGWYLVAVGCSAGAGQQQGQDRALQLLTNLPQEVPEGAACNTPVRQVPLSDLEMVTHTVQHIMEQRLEQISSNDPHVKLLEPDQEPALSWIPSKL